MRSEAPDLTFFFITRFGGHEVGDAVLQREPFQTHELRPAERQPLLEHRAGVVLGIVRIGFGDLDPRGFVFDANGLARVGHELGLIFDGQHLQGTALGQVQLVLGHEAIKPVRRIPIVLGHIHDARHLVLARSLVLEATHRAQGFRSGNQAFALAGTSNT